MLSPPRFHHIDHCLPTGYAFLIGAVLGLAGCVSNTPSLTNLESDSVVPAPEFIPVTRYGRYTLVELSPAAAQQDLLLQVVDVSIPTTLNVSVGDGLRHVLQRSGYELCSGVEVDSFNLLPLPAPHYYLGPLVLRDALQTLVGTAWELHVDQRTRQVCFTAPLSAPAADILLPPITEEVAP